MSNGVTLADILATLSTERDYRFTVDDDGDEADDAWIMRPKPTARFRVAIANKATNIKVTVRDDDLERAIRRAFDAVRN